LVIETAKNFVLVDMRFLPNIASGSSNGRFTPNCLKIVPIHHPSIQVDASGSTPILRAQSTPISYQGMSVLFTAGFHQHLLFLFSLPPPI
jgi:hypothetical protein